MMAHTPPSMEDNAGVVDLSDPANILMRGSTLLLGTATDLLDIPRQTTWQDCIG